MLSGACAPGAAARGCGDRTAEGRRGPARPSQGVRRIRGSRNALLPFSIHRRERPPYRPKPPPSSEGLRPRGAVPVLVPVGADGAAAGLGATHGGTLGCRGQRPRSSPFPRAVGEEIPQ